MPSTLMRDSSTDYRTYWLQGGQYYSKMNGLGALPCVLPKDKLAQIPADDRQIVVEETSADPVFCRFVAKLMETQPDWAHRLSASAKAAADSVLNPSKRYGGQHAWPKLQARVRELSNEVAQQAQRLAAQLTPAERFALVKRIAAGEFRVPKDLRGLGDLGQWDIIGSLVGSLATAGASLYGAKVTANAQEDIAKLQASAAMQGAQAQIAIAQAQASIAQAQAQVSSSISSAVSSLTSTTVAGVPIIVPILGAVAIGLWLAFGRK